MTEMLRQRRDLRARLARAQHVKEDCTLDAIRHGEREGERNGDHQGGDDRHDLRQAQPALALGSRPRGAQVRAL
jgi:hypothetical protein